MMKRAADGLTDRPTVAVNDSRRNRPAPDDCARRGVGDVLRATNARGQAIVKRPSFRSIPFAVAVVPIVFAAIGVYPSDRLRYGDSVGLDNASSFALLIRHHCQWFEILLI
uniref:Uncharacterized protein n=1 Tax=Plectus sambesii TaxID=2011161 RepID=A0A914VCE7_9BILA